MAFLYTRPKTIEELMDYSVTDRENVMDARSDRLDPITSSTYRYRFRVDSYGYCGRDSVLLFKLVGDEGTDVLRTNIMSGGLGAISLARLSVGDQIIQETRDFNQVIFSDYIVKLDSDSLSKYHSHFYGLAQDVAVVEDETSTLAAQAGAHVGQVIEGEKAGLRLGDFNATTAGTVRSHSITQTASNNYQIGIPLHVLFPCLQARQLPLFLFDGAGHIYIDIEFATSDVYVNNVKARAANTDSQLASSTAVTPTDVFIEMDYLVYPSEVVLKEREMTEKEGGLLLSYYSYKVIEKQLPATTADVQQVQDFKIGLSELEVHSIQMIKKLTTATGAAFDGRNRSVYPPCLISDGMPEESYNVSVNGVDVFPEFFGLKSTQHDLHDQALGVRMKQPRSVYYSDKNDIASGLASRHSGLQGVYSPLSLDLRNGLPVISGGGTPIGAYPITWKYRRTARDSSAYDSAIGDVNSTIGEMDIMFLCKVSTVSKIESTMEGIKVTVSGA
jgi:hypothetical protein